MTDRKPGLTYADSGVDIDAGNRLVDLIKPMVRATARAGADSEIGGFGGLFDLKAAGFTDPVLVAATDGVAPARVERDVGGHLADVGDERLRVDSGGDAGADVEGDGAAVGEDRGGADAVHRSDDECATASHERAARDAGERVAAARRRA